MAKIGTIGSNEGKRRAGTVRDLTLPVSEFNSNSSNTTTSSSTSTSSLDMIPSEQKDILSLTLLRVLQSNEKVSTEEGYVARLTSIPKHGCMVNLGRRK